ncbi:DUF3887 domain-containing protein [Megamonas hypermegale]|uniref:DUF3887 domain-containing protein n=1 Tax=Megamonas hypermegale TaxID=158847 RepID=UPI0026EB6CE6|nr:DUF3887 domain-containing protein [Megamonas hypermegale]
MKKLILVLTAVMMMAFSGICMASDSGDLDKEQKIADTFIQAVTTDKVTYDNMTADLSNGLKEKMDVKAFDKLKNDVKMEFGDLKEVKFYSFERYGQNDRVSYVATFSKEPYVAMIFGFDASGKMTEVGILKMQQKNEEAQNTEQQAQAAQQ